jgi:catechol 2,3-dioxygenase-like lactoylglutathione lyase family enzyme
MSISLDHTIVPARDKRRSAEFLAALLGLDVGAPFGPFVPVRVGASTLDYADSTAADIESRHYAFRRIREAGLRYHANPHEPLRYGEINTERGGRSVYFPDPDGHLLEILTAG